MLTRKRPPSVDTYEKSRSCPLPKCSAWDRLRISVTYPSSSAARSSRNLIGRRSPCMRSMGGTPTARCTSEQPCCAPSFRNASIRAKDDLHGGSSPPLLPPYAAEINGLPQKI